MKIAVYNRGGFNSSRHAERWGSVGFSGSCARYTNKEKLNILSLVEKMNLKEEMKVEEGLNAAQAALALQISPSLISRWDQKKEDLQASDGKITVPWLQRAPEGRGSRTIRVR